MIFWSDNMKRKLYMRIGIGIVILLSILTIYLTKGPSKDKIMFNFPYPILEVKDFNRFLSEYSITWNDIDSNGTFLSEDGSLKENEFSGEGIKNFILKYWGKHYFSNDFAKPYSDAIEKLRLEKVKAELKLTFVVTETTDLTSKLSEIGITDPNELKFYKDGIRKLLEAAPIIHSVYQKQIGLTESLPQPETDEDKELISRYGHPWCLSDKSVFCVAHKSLPKRKSGVIGEEVGCEIANKTGSPFEAIFKLGNNPILTPFSKMWPNEHSQIASILKSAARIFSNIQREKSFVEYLLSLSSAFESQEPYPYSNSDTKWTDFLNSSSIIFARIGADEVGGDGVGDNCESRARYHFNLGIRNKEVKTIISKLNGSIPILENKLSALISDPTNYQPRDIKVQLPIFVDVIYQNGDDIGGPSGTNIGQTLPNWCGTDGKGECMRGTMIYVNKTLKAYSEENMRKYILPLFNDEYLSIFNAKRGLDSVVYHEIFHNLGPREKIKKPNSSVTYGESLTTSQGTSWQLPLEELKAQTGSLYTALHFYNELNKKKKIKKKVLENALKEFKEHVLYDLAWAFRMILRGSRNGPEFNPSSPYSKLAAVQIGFFAENGALIFNEVNQKWSINFEKMMESIEKLMKKIGELYSKGDATEVETFFLHYMKGEGEKLLHRDRILSLAREMPSVIFKYEVK